MKLNLFGEIIKMINSSGKRKSCHLILKAPLQTELDSIQFCYNFFYL